jgi:anthranilate synthase component 2
VVDDKNFPKELKITARSLDDNEIMALEHKEFPLFGVQFHPESILTDEGMKIIKNFLKIKKDG